MFLSIWQALPTSIQPELSLVDWSVREIDCVRGIEHVLVGYCVENSEGRTSSAIQAIDPKSMVCTTVSGRVYRLLGGPGNNVDADYVFSGWRIVNSVTKVSNVSEQLWQQHLLLTSDDQAQAN